MWSVLWAQEPVDCASGLKFVFIAFLAQFHPIYTLLCLFLPRSGMAHKSRHPSRVIYLGDHSGSRGVELAGWAPRVGRSVYKWCISPDLARLPARGAQSSGTGYAPGGVAGRERLPGRGRHRRRIAGTAHLDQRHGGRRAQGGIPREEGECSSASRPRGRGGSGAGGGWTRG